jgi:hypothetical protein
MFLIIGEHPLAAILDAHETSKGSWTFAAGALAGGLLVGWYSWQVLSRQMVSKEIDVAFQACEQAEWLAQLRLNEPQAAIKQLEHSMDIEVATLAQWADAMRPSNEVRERRDKFLVPVKVYHESYPATGEEAPLVNSLLASVPGRDLKKVCRSGICKLDDLRRAAAVSTNSLAK